MRPSLEKTDGCLPASVVGILSHDCLFTGEILSDEFNNRFVLVSYDWMSTGQQQTSYDRAALVIDQGVLIVDFNW